MEKKQIFIVRSSSFKKEEEVVEGFFYDVKKVKIKRRVDKKRLLIAYHEAGHAVMCQELDVRVDSVSIWPKIGDPGLIDGVWHEELNENDWCKEIMILAAGPLAEYIHCGGLSWSFFMGADGDAAKIEDCRHQGMKEFESSDATFRIALLFVITYKILKKRWDDVKAIAEYLEAEKKISGKNPLFFRQSIL